MGILDYQLGPKDRKPDDVQPHPSCAGAGPDVDHGRTKTKTEKDLRRVQSAYDPESGSFKGRGKQ
jgi:hypothetical protein